MPGAHIARMEFDASIDLTTDHVPAHIPPSAAIERVRAAVERLAGANWISVEWCGSCHAVVDWVRAYKRGESRIMQGETWDTLKVGIKATVAAALGHDFP
jgi:hypothetical protein